ncbi:hypothetical protein H8A95_20615 [Bradyrhizobium sp. Pear76]|uniref:pilus assembly protein TadG-related protein n=1 Tax=Bradyrhizobium oropedii TaxID=1571201 RepID=UPI001E4551C1|nr:pilus assembly protein TadG-related protein [Bradyrhizobium oropedii]MCC8964652.1 hypothetical protein [Bradyrhizobium oropedii]
MRNILRCRQGSAAFATVIALIPLIGVLALGGEAGSWYATRQRAQNAADAAAYSAALRLACADAGQTGVTCSDTSSVDYRGKEFAAQNAFCNTGDTSYPGSLCPATLPSGLSQSVTIAQLSAWNGTSCPSGTNCFVQATVTQAQPAYFAKLLGLSTVTLGAVGTAQVKQLAKPCVLALSGAISFHDSAVNVQAPNCGLASNSTGIGFNFQANPTVNAGSLSTSGSCSGDTTNCNKVLTYAPKVPNPLSALDTAMTTPSNLTLPSCGSNLTPYTTSTQCANAGPGNGAITTSGVYFFSDLSLKGSTKALFTCDAINGSNPLCGGVKGVSATIILLPGATLRMTGNTSFSITAQATVSLAQLPPRLQSVAGELSDVAFYDTESGTPKISGNPNISFAGVFYAPNMDLSFNGHPTITPLNTIANCAELFAASIELVGSPTFSNSGCAAGVVPVSQLVRMVQ